ncbi:MAG: hypothetical protein IT423_08760 [Pirellulaceae bacterium]|nr:hypothetical protein [Pirellulaceae bacterium]
MSATIRFRLYGRRVEQPPQAGVPLSISWERALANLELLPRMFAEPDGSFLWSGHDERVGPWQLEGTLFDDGQVVRRIELVGNCPPANWLGFLQALETDWHSISVELLDESQVVDGHWLAAALRAES